MAQPMKDERYQAYWDAIRQKVCSVCLDVRDDRTCGLASGRVCAIETHLPRLLDVLLEVHSDRMDEYVDAVKAQICSGCNEQDAHGRCDLRDGGECALWTYLPLVLDAIEEVRQPGLVQAKASGPIAGS